MSGMIKYLMNHRLVENILGSFSSEIIQGFKQVKEKINVKETTDILYRKWFYAPMKKDTYLNPSIIINSMAQNYERGSYWVIPYVEAIEETKKRELNFKVSFRLFSINEHPVIRDLKKIVERSKEGFRVVDNKYFIEGGEELLDELNYKDEFYLGYLIKLAHRLGLINEVVIMNEKAYTEGTTLFRYLVKDNEEKMIEIIKESIEISVEMINKCCSMVKPLDSKELMGLLDNGKSFMSFYKEMDAFKCLIHEMVQHGITDGNITENDIAFAEDTGDSYFYAINMSIEKWFIGIFAHYLGIIKTNNQYKFNIIDNMKGLCRAKNQVDREIQRYMGQSIYDLTPLGERVLSRIKTINSEKHFDEIRKEDINRIMKNTFGEDYKEESKDHIQEDSGYIIDYDVEMELDKQREEFFEYLVKERKYIEFTAFHYSLRVNTFRMYSYEKRKLLDVNELNVAHVKEYLEYFCGKESPAKGSIEDEFILMKHYVRFLKAKKNLHKDTYKEIMDFLKRRKEYI